jgi:hypothetical protein
MNNSAANTPPTRSKPAAKPANQRKVSPEIHETGACSSPVRFAFVPIVREFRAHTQKNYARLWIPIETSLLVRYEFASCSLQTRYLFVAIVLYCGANGLDEIPLDAKFMASVLVADERTVEKSFVELISKKLLVEREKREKRKEQTDRQDAAGAGVLCVKSENLFQEIAEEEKTENENPLLKIVLPGNESNGNKHSLYSIEECLRYVEVCRAKGEAIQSPKALANHLHKTGEADAFILATLYPEKARQEESKIYGEPVKFSADPCTVCFGARMEITPRGARPCPHCRNERGKATGFEPERENTSATDDTEEIQTGGAG